MNHLWNYGLSVIVVIGGGTLMPDPIEISFYVAVIPHATGAYAFTAFRFFIVHSVLFHSFFILLTEIRVVATIQNALNRGNLGRAVKLREKRKVRLRVK